jgi:hypothetical protein
MVSRSKDLIGKVNSSDSENEKEAGLMVNNKV